jgi:hypothetical protein
MELLAFFRETDVICNECISGVVLSAKAQVAQNEKISNNAIAMHVFFIFITPFRNVNINWNNLQALHKM